MEERKEVVMTVKEFEELIKSIGPDREFNVNVIIDIKKDEEGDLYAGE